VKKLILLLSVNILIFINITGCKDEEIVPVQTGSDLTRSGKFLSFTSNIKTNYDIFLAQINNGVLETDTANFIYPANPWNLTLLNTSDDKESNWSPDGRVLVFSRTNGGEQQIYSFFFNADGSLNDTVTPNPKNLFSSGGNWDNNPSFSSDGHNLIWDRRYDNASPPGVDTADSRDLYIGDISGTGNNFQVSNIRAIRTTSGEDEYNPKWSPRISVGRVAYEYQSSATSTDHDVYVIDPFNPSNNTNFYNPNNSGYPAWKPECDKIILESDKSPGDFWKIVSLGYPGNNGNPTDVQYEPNVHLRYPTWLPNGGLIAYIKLDAVGNGNIWLTSTSGGTPSKLLVNLPGFDAANNLWPAW
jgi:Tol biopolymer transport system component